VSKDTLNYDDLTESQKRKLKEFALTKAYRIEGIQYFSNVYYAELKK